jgi:hypothetical protein
MTILSSQLVWVLISYLGTKLASKTWGRVILSIGRGYLAAKGDGRAESHAARFDGTRPLTPEERARLDDAERRAVDHRPPGDATA